MTILQAFIISATLYITGLLIGRKLEKNKICNGLVGYVAEVNESNKQLESVTYYYSEDAYNQKLKELKENGVDYHE